ncbi:hypothetical protein [Streptomyces sp. NBC_01565]|uniref:ATP-dependent DNA ligase n=1 Tax=unclassified Streptomyces TaxID=2593676 RepID=UPI00224DF933|nr:hypothetical protein [Streptomyces sp. NBC_01565]MCX4546349.1 hypothetical protein [Streptomyces sp. NBC_01565]
MEPKPAQAEESVPDPSTLGSAAFERKYDGHRVAVHPGGAGRSCVLLQTRPGTLLQDRFADPVAAVAQLAGALALDGELVAWVPEEAGLLSPEALQRAARGRSAPTGGRLALDRVR